MLLSTTLPDSFLQEYCIKEILIIQGVLRIFFHSFITLWQGGCHVGPVRSE